MRVGVGEVVQGKLDAYRLDSVVVNGRFGTTYHAVRQSDDEAVIVKTVACEVAPSWEVVEAFERQAERLRQLEHANVARYLDDLQIREGGQVVALALVQEAVEGISLQEVVAGRHRMEEAEVRALFVALFGALDALHAQRPPVVHADIDPGNIYIRPDGSPVLVDFATARYVVLDAATLARGMATGALDYAPCEQLIGQIYPGTDVYALGMSLLAALSRTPPAEMPTQHIRADVRAMLGDQLDESTLVLLEQITEPNPGARLANAALVRERLTMRARPSDHGSAASAAMPWDRPEQARGATSGDASLDEAQREVLRELVLQADEYRHELRRGEGLGMPPEPSFNERVHAFAITDDGTRMILAHAHDGLIVDTATMKVRSELSFGETASRVAISADGARVAVLTGFEDLLLYDVGMTTWLKHEITVDGMWPGHSQLTISPDGERVAISDDDQVNIYEWSTGRMVMRHDVDGQFGLVYSPDGEVLFAVGEAATTALMGGGGDAHRHALLPFEGVAFSSDGEQMAYVQGDTLHLGDVPARFEEAPTLTHRISLDGVMARQRANLLRFGPDVRHLLVAGKDGGMVMVRLGGAPRVLPWHDRRAREVDGVKAFAAGFSGDERRVFVHTTLEPDTYGSPKLGGVFAFAIDAAEPGAFLGAITWRDRNATIQSASGFLGALADLGSPSYSQDLWERPDLALAEFEGRDVWASLQRNQRAALQDLLDRHQAVAMLDARFDEPLPRRELLDASKGLAFVYLHLFERALERFAAQQARDYTAAPRTLGELLIATAHDLQDQRPAELDELYARQLADAASHTTPSRPPKDRAPEPPRAQVWSPTPEDDAQDDREALDEALEAAMVRDLGAPALAPRMVVDEGVIKTRHTIQRLVLGAALAYAVILPVVVFFKLSAPIFALLMGAVGPVVAIVLGLTVGRLVYR